MRVKGNVIPQTISMEAYGPKAGMVELRLRENVKEAGGEYVYDEYVFHLPEAPELREQVEKNLPQWLATGRSMEMGENSSLAADLRSALSLIMEGDTRGRELEMAISFRQEMQQALQLVYDSLNQGQRQKLMKEETVKNLFSRYGVEGAL